MHIALNAHVFFLILALVLGLCATFNVPSSRVSLLAASWVSFLLAEFFT